MILFYSGFIIDVIHATRLAQSKRNCINEIVSSKLFRIAECRSILLPIFCQQINEKLTKNDEVSGARFCYFSALQFNNNPNQPY